MWRNSAFAEEISVRMSRIEINHNASAVYRHTHVNQPGEDSLIQTKLSKCKNEVICKLEAVEDWYKW